MRPPFLLAPTPTRNSSSDSFWSAFPWKPAPGVQPEGYYHASTQLPSGQLSIMLDIGAWTNIAGAKIGRAIAATALAAGRPAQQQRMDRPLSIMGVGNGTQECKWEGKFPICLEGTDGTADQVHRFDAPLVEGTGEDLPAILGLRSVKAKQGVIETENGKEMLSLPGPGGYEIKWSPGTQHIRLRNAPSGHMVIPLSDFKKVSAPKGGLAERPRVIHTATETSARGSDDPAPSSR